MELNGPSTVNNGTMKMMDLIYGNDPADTLVDFIRFAMKELGLSEMPSIKLLDDTVTGKESNSFAAYVPGSKRIILYTKHRHILDILRSLGHEMVHFRQDLEGRLKPDSGRTGSEHENEANAVAGQIMRKYGKMHPELFR
jgi:hypothetical protein